SCKNLPARIRPEFSAVDFFRGTEASRTISPRKMIVTRVAVLAPGAGAFHDFKFFLVCKIPLLFMQIALDT
ncbi:MAG: hypothetical protein DME72_02035, partial [Verrucomicrobia bacterium]